MVLVLAEFVARREYFQPEHQEATARTACATLSCLEWGTNDTVCAYSFIPNIPGVNVDEDIPIVFGSLGQIRRRSASSVFRAAGARDEL